MQKIERLAPVGVRTDDTLLATCFRLAVLIAEQGWKLEGPLPLRRLELYRVTNRNRSDFAGVVLDGLLDEGVLAEVDVPDDSGGVVLRLAETGRLMFAN